MNRVNYVVSRCRRGFSLALPALLVALFAPFHLDAQTVGSILGRVVDAQSGQPLEAATIELVGTQLRTISGADGRFVMGAVPPGERSLRIEHLGYKPMIVEGIVVRTGRSQDVRVELDVAPVALPGVVVEVERVRLIEPDVSTTHDIIVSRELRALPVDRLQQVIELTPGVSGGHFRGGRVGQEVHVVDGIELKNQFEAARDGSGLELSPSSLEEVEVITGGFGAQYGSALSGVVSYVTRRGNPERWESRASLLTDQWAPAGQFRGFSAVSLSAGGPLSFLGGGTTMFADVLGQAMLDAEPHARGLTCLREEDATDGLAAEIRGIREGAPGLYCPYSHAMLPHQRGDKLIAFARLDRPITPNLNFNVTLLRNRSQRELYTSEFRYSNGGQLGQRMVGTLGTANLDWSRNSTERAVLLAARVAGMRMDRYVGALDPQSFEGTRIGGFNLSGFRFHGESYTRSSIETQIAAPAPVPGYVMPGGTEGTPFGLAASGIFFTGGTPHLASWAATDMLSTDIVGEILAVSGNSMRGGISSKLYRVESYERTLSYLAGSAPNYARFFPAVMSGFTEGRIAVADEMTINIGVRADAFRSGIAFRADRSDFLSPVIDSRWNISVNPRFGVAMPIPGTDGSAALRFNYGYVSQPPDFRYFLDTAVGDSLRTDIRRQGNPALSFEQGKSYEVGASKLIGSNAGLGMTLFRKELSHLVSGSMRLGETGDMLYSTDDEGTVQGVETSLRGRWSDFGLRASYALQKATGVASGTESDSLLVDHQFVEYPLAFDRRHSIDFAAFYGRAAGAESPWSAAIVASAKSGYPIDRIAAADGTLTNTYLPWTSNMDLRLSRELGRLPGCGGCTWRVTFDGRNIVGVENVMAVRRDTGGRAPALTAVRALADAMPAPPPIPAESPLYTRSIDVNGDGVITPAEFRMARMAAAIDRFDPSLYFGEPRQLRLGMEIVF
ncbi:hypothetical protein BH23GEM9_BH23GEM9_35680 [soil metagenome]